MKEDNYLTLLDFPIVAFSGFSDLQESAYVKNMFSRRTILIERNPAENPNNRFPITLDNFRRTSSEQLYGLIKEYGLEKRHFIYDGMMQIYFATNIPAKKEPSN